MADATAKPENQPQPYGPLVNFKGGATGLPSVVYVTEDDTYRVRSWAPSGTQTIRLTMRVLNPQGIVIPVLQTIVVTANGATPQVNVFNGDEGFLLSASVDCDATQQGFCFVQVAIQRGTGSGDTALGMVLMQGYASIYNMLCYPQSPLTSSVDGRGAMRILSGSAPAAGANVLQVVSAGREWILRAVSIPFVTTAVAGSRIVTLFVDDGGAAPVAHSTTAAIGTSQTLVLSWGAGHAAVAGNPTFSYPLTRELRLLPAWRIQTQTAALDVGDQFGTPRFLVEEFIAQ